MTTNSRSRRRPPPLEPPPCLAVCPYLSRWLASSFVSHPACSFLCVFLFLFAFQSISLQNSPPPPVVLHPFVPVSLNSCPLIQVLDMSSTPTFRGTTSHRTVGRGRLPDFGGDSASHIPRPRHESSSTITSSQAPHTPGSDIGSSTMSAASSRQRQNQSKRDEVCKFPFKPPTRRH